MECEVCGLDTASEEDAVCMFCFISGRYFDQVLRSEERSYMLSKIRGLEEVVRALVCHNGHGCFSVMVQLEDGRMILPGMYIEQIGIKAVIPGVPPIGMPWGIHVASSIAPKEGDMTPLPDPYDDEGVVEAIKTLAKIGIIE